LMGSALKTLRRNRQFPQRLHKNGCFSTRVFKYYHECLWSSPWKRLWGFLRYFKEQSQDSDRKRQNVIRGGWEVRRRENQAYL